MKHIRWQCLLGVALFLLMPACGSKDSTRQQAAAGTRANGRGLLVVSFAPDSADTFSRESSDSVLVIDWLKSACDSAHVTLDIKEYPFGTLVNGIGPRRNGTGGNWLYRVNGRMMAKAASACKVAPTDTVMFLFK